MKKIILITFIGLALTACDDGGMLDINTPQAKSDAVSRLEATGFDLRIYEFTPQTAAGMQCIFVAGNQKAGLNCFPKLKP